MRFISIALWFACVDVAFNLVQVADVFPAVIHIDIGTRLAFAGAAVLIGAGIGVLLGLSGELLVALAMAAAIFGAIAHSAGALVRAAMPVETELGTILAAGLDLLVAAVYIIAVAQMLSRQNQPYLE